MVKNERARLKNVSRASAAAASTSPALTASLGAEPGKGAGKWADREKRKEELKKSIGVTRASTASLGRFDKALVGEPKMRNLKRKVSLLPA